MLRGRLALVFAGVAMLAVGASNAHAHTIHRSDPRGDARASVDISSVTVTHSRSILRFEIRGYHRIPSAYRVCVGIGYGRVPVNDYTVCGGRLSHEERGRIGRVDVDRPDRRTVVYRVPRRMIGSPRRAFKWVVYSTNWDRRQLPPADTRSCGSYYICDGAPRIFTRHRLG